MMAGKPTSTMTANDIVAFLRATHQTEVCVPQCKGGPTWGGGNQCMDLWVMYRTWSPTRILGYEVKVSRSDWLRDDKWRSYLQFCNEFYFVCPSGLIQKEEVPAPAGLKWVTDKGRVTTRKKADFRDTPINPDVFRYIIMSRCNVADPKSSYDSNNDQTHANKELFFRRWMASERIDREFGHMVSARIRRAVEKNILEVSRENDRLSRRITELQDVKKMLEGMGMKPGEDANQFQVRQYMRENSLLPPGMPAALEELLRHARTSQINLQWLVRSAEQILRDQPKSEAMLETAWRQEMEERIRKEMEGDGHEQ